MGSCDDPRKHDCCCGTWERRNAEEGDCEVETARNIGGGLCDFGKVVRINKSTPHTEAARNPRRSLLAQTPWRARAKSICCARCASIRACWSPPRSARPRVALIGTGARATGPAREKQMISLHRNSDGLLAGRPWRGGTRALVLLLSQGSPARLLLHLVTRPVPKEEAHEYTVPPPCSDSY